MTPEELSGFFVNPDTLNAEDHIVLDYYFECVGDPREAAAHLCSEQSTAQWRRTGVDEDFRPRFAAKIMDLHVEGALRALSYPVPADTQGGIFACRAKIAHPHANFGPRIPNLLSAVAGEGPFFCPGIPIIKLLDIQFPRAYLHHFDGPRFGVDGLREQLSAFERPIFFGVIKPNIGLAPEPFCEAGYQSWLGGLDIAKDDEMLADVSWSTLEHRSQLMGAARRRAEAETGVPKCYLANITDEVDRLKELHDLAVGNGANALMLNALPVGLSAVRMLRRHTEVPLVAHFPFIAAFSRLERFGVHSRVMTKLQRLAGFDVIIMPGFGSRMMTSEEEVLQNVAACREDMGTIRASLPVPGGSDWAGSLPTVYERLGTTDFGFVPGRGVFGHPMGPRGGAASIRQAWEAISRAVPLPEYARNHPELRAALDHFGRGARAGRVRD